MTVQVARAFREIRKVPGQGADYLGNLEAGTWRLFLLAEWLFCQGLRGFSIVMHREAAMYLWLSCEGWGRFGPYRWLRFRDDARTIEDQNGDVVAQYADGCWRVGGERASWLFRDPMITESVRHPHPMRG